MNTWTDSLGIKHNIHEPLLKAGPAAIAADPHQGQFRALVDDMIALRDRSRVAERAKVQTVRQRPARRPAKPLRKSLESLARETQRMAAQVQRQTEAIQRQTAIAMLDDLDNAARAGRLGAIEAAKLDALRHRNARALNLEVTGVRR